MFSSTNLRWYQDLVILSVYFSNHSGYEEPSRFEMMTPTHVKNSTPGDLARGMSTRDNGSMARPLQTPDGLMNWNLFASSQIIDANMSYHIIIQTYRNLGFSWLWPQLVRCSNESLRKFHWDALHRFLREGGECQACGHGTHVATNKVRSRTQSWLPLVISRFVLSEREVHHGQVFLQWENMYIQIHCLVNSFFGGERVAEWPWFSKCWPPRHDSTTKVVVV